MTRGFGDMNSNIDDILKQKKYVDKMRDEGYEAFPNAFTGHGPDQGPFGTVQNPVQVPSGEPSRIVGCLGGFTQEGEDRRHDLVWFSVGRGDKHMCSNCGQIFVLVDAEEFDPEDE